MELFKRLTAVLPGNCQRSSCSYIHKLSESFLEPVIFRGLYRTGDRWEILKFAQHPQADMCKQMFLYSNKL